MRLIVALLLVIPSLNAKTLSDFLPEGRSYAAQIVKPAEVFGFEPGERHLRHDQLLAYLRRLAEQSERVSIQTTGRTHELREQVLVAISHPDNISRLDAIRENHLAYIHGASDDPGPLIVWLGYSIHGNEASGSNAAPIVAYHLAAGQDLEAWLAQTVVLIDPSLNPDGMGRFAHWANSNRAEHPVKDPRNREHREYWPGGRFNHYWADLNRDWLLLTHPESRNRVRVFQDWRPHVFGDFHEMGGSTYFFQPGVVERQNPLTPQTNLDLTRRIAEFHARALDARSELYFSEEMFDDYYYGKGSTYPDVQGSVGILFEQSSVRGHARKMDDRDMTFADAVHNHFTTSLSTLEGATAVSSELKAWQRSFVVGGLERGRRAGFAGFVFGDASDPARGFALAQLLRQHGIDVRSLSSAVSVDDQIFEPGASFVVPAAQAQYPLVEAMFETRTEFVDTTFYDVSTWTFPMAFDLPYARVRSLAAAANELVAPSAAVAVTTGSYAYAIRWDQTAAAAALAALQRRDIPVRAATAPFSSGDQSFDRGTLIVAGRGDSEELATALEEVAALGALVSPISSGLTVRGPDLGSPSMEVLKPPHVAMLTGPGVDARAAGEVWRLLDLGLAAPPVMIDTIVLDSTRLDDFTHLIVVDGGYDGVSVDSESKLRTWIAQGGTLVALQDGAAWATRRGLHLTESTSDETEQHEGDQDEGDQEPPVIKPYASFDDDYSKTVVGGAIVKASVDATHPLAYGYQRPELHLFRNGESFFEPDASGFQTPLRYLEQPLVSGYMGQERLQQLAGSAAARVDHAGQGRMICFADNPVFRGYFRGTERLLLNAIFFSQLIDRTDLPEMTERL